MDRRSPAVSREGLHSRHLLLTRSKKTLDNKFTKKTFLCTHNPLHLPVLSTFVPTRQARRLREHGGKFPTMKDFNQPKPDNRMVNQIVVEIYFKMY
jgi:hypothetical protein